MGDYPSSFERVSIESGVEQSEVTTKGWAGAKQGGELGFFLSRASVSQGCSALLCSRVHRVTSSRRSDLRRSASAADRLDARNGNCYTRWKEGRGRVSPAGAEVEDDGAAESTLPCCHDLECPPDDGRTFKSGLQDSTKLQESIIHHPHCLVRPPLSTPPEDL